MQFSPDCLHIYKKNPLKCLLVLSFLNHSVYQYINYKYITIAGIKLKD